LGACAGFALVGMWGYVLDLVHTGHLLGRGFGADVGASPSFPGSPKTTLHVLYRMFDLSVLSDRLIDGLAIAGLVAAALVGAYRYRQAGLRPAVLRAAAVAIPLTSPFLVLGGAAVLAYVTKQLHVPVHSHEFAGGVNRRSNEDYSAFGPVGAVMLLGVSVLAWFGRRDPRRLALAATLPVFLVLLGLEVAYNPFVTRFLVVPAVLVAPLFGIVLRSRFATGALLVIASITVLQTLEHDRTKPYRTVAGTPWHLNQADALQYIFDPDVAPAYKAYESAVPARACVGAVLGPDEPSYLLWGRGRTRRVYFLPASGALQVAYSHGLDYVVISARSNAASADQFRGAGWTVGPLADYWLLASSPRATDGCT
jgi:hypothetical protein